MRNIRSIAILAVLAAAAMVAGNCRGAEQRQAKLIKLLKSHAAPAEKALACKQLAICGNQDAVPALAALLADAQLSSWARIALEAIPGPAADDALREALGKVHGGLLLGVINSLGVRRDVKAVGQLARGSTTPTSKWRRPRPWRWDASAATRPPRPWTASLADSPPQSARRWPRAASCARERSLAEGKPAAGRGPVRRGPQGGRSPQQVREAIRGVILARGTAGVPLLVEQLQSADKARFRPGLARGPRASGPRSDRRPAGRAEQGEARDGRAC